MFSETNSEDFDFNPANIMKKSFIIAATPRSGSSLLGKLLWDTGIAGAPIEYFHKSTTKITIIDGEINDFNKYIELLTLYRTSQNGVFGIKIHFRQLINFKLNEEKLKKLLKNPKYIFIKEDQKERQALSYYKARETKQWVASNNDLIKNAEYDFIRIRCLLESLILEEKSWESFFKENNINPYVVYYEDLIIDKNKYIKEILDFLEIDTQNLVMPQVDLKKMSNNEIEEWLIQFKNDMIRFGVSIDANIDINSFIADTIVKKIEKGITSVSIWGIGELSDIVEKKLAESNVKVNYFIDTWATDEKFHKNIKVITPKEAIEKGERNFIITSLANRFNMEDIIVNMTDEKLEIFMY